MAIGLVVLRMLGGGATPARSQWPLELGDMVAVTRTPKSEIKLMVFYGGFLDEESVWRLTASPEQHQNLVENLKVYELAEVEAKTVPTDFEHIFPVLWRPTRNAACRFFTTPDFPWNSRGQDGTQFALMYDPNSQHLFVWNKDNF
ncbi:MAG: hypothetical protein AB8G99_14175 [Planctomycetaceae bacterium]